MNGLPINIDDLLHGRSVEWERLEFKEGWNPLEVLHSICAFANDIHNMGGGYIVVGVAEDHGRPVVPPKGVEPGMINHIQKEILNMGHSAIQPSYHPVVVPHAIGEKVILIIWVPGGQPRPYKARTGLGKEEKGFVYFIRKNSSTVKAKGLAEQELLSLAANVPFDDRVNQQAKVVDLDRRLMRAFLVEVGSDLVRTAADADTLQLARHMKLVGGQPEAPFPLNVGLLFFNPDPQARFFPTARIEVAWFPDGPAGDTFTEKIFTGPLDRMLREALDYIQRNYINEIVVKHAHRAKATRSWNYPYAALEEALVNALYHRSYEEREPIEVRITPDELTILSYPGPDRSINMEQLRAGRAVSRRYRNRRIGEFLKELELTEGRATGIPKIIRTMRENGSPEPLFETEDERITFLVRLPAHPDTAMRHAMAPSGPGTDQVADKSNFLTGRFIKAVVAILATTTDQVADQVTDQVTGEVARTILETCLKPASAKILMEVLDLRHGPTFRGNYLRPLMNLRLLEMTLPGKPTSRFQGYRTTEKGREVLAQLYP